MNYITRAKVRQGDAIRWKVNVDTTNGLTTCQNKDVKIASIEPIPCYGDMEAGDGDPRDGKCTDTNTGTSATGVVPPFLCSIRADAKVGCYKYSIGGGVDKDPEIEVEPPRGVGLTGTR